MKENPLRKINKSQFDKIVIALLGNDHVTLTGTTHVMMKAGKCAILDGQCYADDNALKLIGKATKRRKRRSY